MKKYKAIAGYTILLATLVYFIYFAKTHQQFWHELNQLSILTVIILLVLYLIFLGSGMLILKYTVEYCKKTIDYKDNFQLSAYSAIINFFGPLQSGPGFRAVYLKANYQITIRNFFEASIVYYLFFAAISAICIVIGSDYWRWTIVLAPLIFIGAYIIFRWQRAKVGLRGSSSSKGIVNRSVALKIGLATLIQITLVVIIYFTELQAVNHLISIRQAIAYAGVANFALFVSITPGAIGIREAFLLFSQRLLHMPGKTIVAASIIDRAVYAFFLGILFLFLAVFHINSKLTKKTELIN